MWPCSTTILWVRRFGADPAVVGTTVDFNGTPYTILGVMPERFELIDPDLEVWTPLTLSAAELSDRSSHYLDVVARLRPGATAADANTQLHALAVRLQAEHPSTNKDLGMYAVPLLDDYVGDARALLVTLLVAVGGILLIACANVANLMLTHAVGRAREMAVRTALGASRTRLIRQLVTESLLLAAAGGAVGIALARPSFSVLALLVPPALSDLGRVTLDWRVLAATASVSVLTGVLFGIVPAWRASRVQLAAGALRSSRGVVGAGSRLRSTFVVAEIALTTMLLIAAGLFVKELAGRARRAARLQARARDDDAPATAQADLLRRRRPHAVRRPRARSRTRAARRGLRRIHQRRAARVEGRDQRLRARGAAP